MKKYLWLAGVAVMALVVARIAVGDDDHEEGGRKWSYNGLSDIGAVTNQKYQAECGSCHLAYQPSLLPKASWERIMSSLDNHFGENAELSAADTQSLLSYLSANAADASRGGRSGAFARYKGEAPLRITETPYFKRKHHEVPARFLKDSRIGSFSNCAACHQGAAKGVYSEDSVNIPGVGRWDD